MRHAALFLSLLLAGGAAFSARGQEIHFKPVVIDEFVPGEVIAETVNAMSDDEEIVVRTILGEARGERAAVQKVYPRVVNRVNGNYSIIGLQAVANVIYNRSLARHQPFRVVCEAPRQFHAFTPPLSELEPLLVFQTLLIARQMLDDKLPDVTEGATHFYSGEIPPWWAKFMTETVTIGHHHFLREERHAMKVRF